MTNIPLYSEVELPDDVGIFEGQAGTQAIVSSVSTGERLQIPLSQLKRAERKQAVVDPGERAIELWLQGMAPAAVSQTLAAEGIEPRQGMRKLAERLDVEASHSEYRRGDAVRAVIGGHKVNGTIEAHAPNGELHVAWDLPAGQTFGRIGSKMLERKYTYAHRGLKHLLQALDIMGQDETFDPGQAGPPDPEKYGPPRYTNYPSTPTTPKRKPGADPRTGVPPAPTYPGTHEILQETEGEVFEYNRDLTSKSGRVDQIAARLKELAQAIAASPQKQKVDKATDNLHRTKNWKEKTELETERGALTKEVREIKQGLAEAIQKQQEDFGIFQGVTFRRYQEVVEQVNDTLALVRDWGNIQTRRQEPVTRNPQVEQALRQFADTMKEKRPRLKALIDESFEQVWEAVQDIEHVDQVYTGVFPLTETHEYETTRPPLGPEETPADIPREGPSQPAQPEMPLLYDFAGNPIQRSSQDGGNWFQQAVQWVQSLWQKVTQSGQTIRQNDAQVQQDLNEIEQAAGNVQRALQTA